MPDLPSAVRDAVDRFVTETATLLREVAEQAVGAAAVADEPSPVAPQEPTPRGRVSRRRAP